MSSPFSLHSPTQLKPPTRPSQNKKFCSARESKQRRNSHHRTNTPASGELSHAHCRSTVKAQHCCVSGALLRDRCKTNPPPVPSSLNRPTPFSACARVCVCSGCSTPPKNIIRNAEEEKKIVCGKGMQRRRTHKHKDKYRSSTRRGVELTLFVCLLCLGHRVSSVKERLLCVQIVRWFFEHAVDSWGCFGGLFSREGEEAKCAAK